MAYARAVIPMKTKMVGDTTHRITSYFTLKDTFSGYIHRITFYQKNDETNAKTARIRVTINGVEYTGAMALVDGTLYDCYLDSQQTHITAAIAFIAGRVNFGYYTKLGGSQVKIEFYFDDAAGTNQDSRCYVLYESY